MKTIYKSIKLGVFMSNLTNIANRAISKKPEDSLILIDCAGTIYQGDFPGDYNDKLVSYIKAMREKGYQIQIFSSDPGGSSFVLSMIEFELDDGFEFGEIHRKDLYRGERAHIVIDDDHETHNVKCDNLYSPIDERIVHSMGYTGNVPSKIAKKDLS